MPNMWAIQSAASFSSARKWIQKWCTCKSVHIPGSISFETPFSFLLKHNKNDFMDLVFLSAGITAHFCSTILISSTKLQIRPYLVDVFIYVERSTNVIEYWHSDAGLKAFACVVLLLCCVVRFGTNFLSIRCRCQHLDFALSNLLQF